MTQDTDCHQQRRDEAVPRCNKSLHFGGNYVGEKTGTSLKLKPDLFPLKLKTKPEIYALKTYFLNDPPFNALKNIP